VSETQTLTLAAFLTARIEELEAVARAALEYLDIYDPDFSGEEDRGSRWLTSRGYEHNIMRGNPFEEFIRSRSPEQALAECEAKRQLLARHMPESVQCAWPRETGYFGTHAEFDERYPGGPCHVLRCLALPYADHPDFQEAWRP